MLSANSTFQLVRMQFQRQLQKDKKKESRPYKFPALLESETYRRILARVRGYFFVITFFNLRCLRTCARQSATVRDCIYALHVKCSLSLAVFSQLVIVNCNAFIGLSLQVLTFLVFVFKEKPAQCHFQFSEEERIFLADKRRKNLLSSIYIKHFYNRSKVTEHREREKSNPLQIYQSLRSSLAAKLVKVI